MNKRVVIGMSGGVDSSVAALLLKNQGYDVVGLFMKNWDESNENGCCNAENDYNDVMRVCAKIGIPYYTINFSKQYWDRVFKEFVEEYREGRTPNPDVMCNREIKFGSFKDYALSMGADYVATGHYCGIENKNGRVWLKKAVDQNKDQTYFLNQVTENQLNNVLFPLAELDKSEVRKIAYENDLATAEKKDSTGVCFIGERNFRNFLSGYIPMKDGDIKTLDGKTVGRHKGVYYYTVGQRHGLGLGGRSDFEGGAWFVLSKDVKNNILYVSQGEDSMLFSSSLDTEGFNFITEEPNTKEFRCEVRIRHRQALQKATATKTSHGLHIAFDNPQRAVASGQYAVVYIGELCYGGGKIV